MKNTPNMTWKHTQHDTKTHQQDMKTQQQDMKTQQLDMKTHQQKIAFTQVLKPALISLLQPKDFVHWMWWW